MSIWCTTFWVMYKHNIIVTYRRCYSFFFFLFVFFVFFCVCVFFVFFCGVSLLNFKGFFCDFISSADVLWYLTGHRSYREKLEDHVSLPCFG